MSLLTEIEDHANGIIARFEQVFPAIQHDGAAVLQALKEAVAVAHENITAAIHDALGTAPAQVAAPAPVEQPAPVEVAAAPVAEEPPAAPVQ